MKIFDRVGLGAGGGGQMVGWGPWGWDSRHGDGVSDKGMGFQSGLGFQTWGWGSRHGMGFQTQKNPNFLYRWRGPLVMIFNRVGLGAEGGARW